MNILKKLSIKNLRINSKRTIGTIIGIILSTALMCAVLSMGFNFQKTILNYEIENDGYYHLNINGLNEKEVEKLNANRDIKNITKIYEIGDSLIDSTNIKIYSMDRQTFNDRSYKIVSGTFPKNENEIIVNDWFLRDNNYQVDDDIEIPISKNGEINENKKYKIVGVVKKDYIGYKEYVITTNEKSNVIDTYITLKNPKNYKEDILNILGEDTKDINKSWKQIRESDYESKNYGSTYTVNDNILRYEVLAFNSPILSSIIIVISIVLIIIIVTSIFCIRNSFAIATTEKTKLYGMLISVGATKKQIRKNVIYEGFILGIVAIPIGIISGYFASYMLVVIMNLIMGDTLIFGSSGISFNINYVPAILAIFLSSITIYLSALSSAIKASHTSPIQQLRNANDIKIKSQKLKTPKIISRLFKTGGVLAFKNLKRSKRKYRTTVISLSVSILVFIALNTFISEVFSVTDEAYVTYDYSLIVSSQHGLTENEIKAIKSIDTVNKTYVKLTFKNGLNIMKTYQLDHSVDKDLFSYQDCEMDENNNEVCGPSYVSIHLSIFDTDTFKEYCKKAKINYEDVKGKAILNDDFSYQDEKGKIIINRVFNYKAGEKLTATLNDVEKDFEIGAITSENPYGCEEVSEPRLIVEESYFDKDELKSQSLYIDSKDNNVTIEKIKAINPSLIVSDMLASTEEMRSLSLIISIFLYGFITVITLIGVTNIFNTITSNMELRQKEFAMLKSVGMTKKEFNRMINLETLFYSFKSLFYGITIGTLLSYLIHLGITKSITLKYHFPITPIIICIIFVILLVSIIMHYSINKINKQNTIETIRNDNI